MKDRIANIVSGSGAALDEHATAIRELQQRVEDLTQVVSRVDIEAHRAAADASALPEALRVAVADLSGRIAEMTARLDELEAVNYQLADVIAAQTTRAE
jgi:hypothetical protein